MITSATTGDEVLDHTNPNREGKSPDWAIAIEVLLRPAKIAAREPRLASAAAAITTGASPDGASSARGAVLEASADTPSVALTTHPMRP
jgi:hypothetical protein